jgi:Domain of unknown function (DUF4331)
MRFKSLLPALALGLTVTATLPFSAFASSHSEAPGTSKDRFIDDTDLYAWVAGDVPSAVTIVGNWAPMLEPNGGPNFYGFDDAAHYYINVDNVGDAQDHIQFQFAFKTTRQNPNTFLYNTGPVTSLTDAHLNVQQTYTVTRYDNGVPTVLGTDIPVAPNFVGPVSMPDYAALAQSAVATLSDGTRVFAGPRDDPFFVDLGATFDLLTIRKVPGNKGKGVDGLSGYDVLTIALQVPKARLTKDGQAPSAAANNHIIGIYDTAERQQTRMINGDGTVSFSGPWMQVSRLGNPLVNEVVIPLKDKDRFNATEPTGDGAFLPYVLDPELAGLLHALYGINVPPAPRNDLVAVFLTGVAGLNQPAGVMGSEMLRLNMTIAPATTPNRFGVIAGDLAGFPNGRRLGDDVVDIAERVVAGVLVGAPYNGAPNNQLGDGIDVNDVPFLPYFPYVALPHDPLSARGHNEQHGNSAASVGGSLGDRLGELTGAATQGGGATEAKLAFAGPNPSSESRLEYTIARNAHVSLCVYDLQGRMIRTLVDQDAAAGSFKAVWNGRTDSGETAGKGVFFARFVTDGKVVESRKIVLD